MKIACEKVMLGNEKDNNGDEYELRDLLEEETEFLDCMLDKSGIIRISLGYSENGRYVVMKGPLKFYEERMVNVDKHNRMAYMDYKAMGCIAKAVM